MQLVVLFETGEGQTLKIADFIAGQIREMGHKVTLVDTSDKMADLSLVDADKVRCHAKAKTTGNRCKCLAVRGWQVCRMIGVTIQTYHRWRKEYGGMSRDQLKRLKELETENQRLKRVVADLSLDKMIFAEAARGNF